MTAIAHDIEIVDYASHDDTFAVAQRLAGRYLSTRARRVPERTDRKDFDDTFTDTLYASTAAYSSRGTCDVRNANDGIYSDGGAQYLGGAEGLGW
jgi:hypothetical protein